jgi:hypothetical protein
MERKDLKGTFRALLPWMISAALLAYVLYTQDLRAVADAFGRARIAPYMVWLLVFVIFWLFCHSLFLFLCIRWFVDAQIPGRPDPSCEEVREFDYFGILRAAAALYLLHILNIVVAYGGLVVYLGRRYGVPYKRGTAVMLMGLLNAFATMGILAFVAVKLLPDELVPIHAQDQIELAGVVGLAGMGFYLLCFSTARLWQYLPERFQEQENVFLPFVYCPIYAWPLLLIIQLVQMASYGLFVILTMPLFGLHPPALAAMALTQVVTIARGLPISAQGIGLDQMTFPYLFQGWGEAGAILAFSIAYTFSKIAFRFLIGVPFFNRATREMFEEGREGVRASIRS